MRNFRLAGEFKSRVSEGSEDSENRNSFDPESAEARKDAENCMRLVRGLDELPAQVEPRGGSDSTGAMQTRAGWPASPRESCLAGATPVSALTASLLVLTMFTPAAGQIESLEQIFLVGAGDGRTTFHQVTDISIGPNGSTFVAERDGTITEMGSHGSVVRQFGGRGGGPGEFIRLERLGWVGDTLWAMEWGRDRITLFPPDLGVVTRRLISDVHPISDMPTTPAALLSSGAILGQPTPRNSDWAAGRIKEAPLLRYNPDGGVYDTLAILDVSHGIVQIQYGRYMSRSVAPYPTQDLWDAGAEGEVVAVVRRAGAAPGTAAEWTVEILDLEQRKRRTVSLPFEPRPIPGDEVDSLVEARAERLTHLGLSHADAAKLVRDSLHLPPSLPPVDDVVVARDGAVMVRLGRSPDRDSGTAEWLVLDRDGTTRTRFTAPARLEIMDAIGHDVWGVLTTDLDVEVIGRFWIPGRAKAESR